MPDFLTLVKPWAWVAIRVANSTYMPRLQNINYVYSVRPQLHGIQIYISYIAKFY
jgi:hypothetical protein